MSNSSQSTASQLRAQWSNPGDILSILLLIGGDIVQKALAQTTAGHIPPVCFSFGWVAYSFLTLVGIIGDGRLLPPPDYTVKLFNLESAYMRENKNWVIGRILRDNEVFMNRRGALNGAGIRISVYTAEAPEKKKTFVFRSERLWFVITAIQVAVASIPLALNREWGVFLITVSGVFAAVIAGKLPQWSVEKLPLKRKRGKHIALTSGNGSREVMVIYSAGEALDLEELAAGESPRSDRVWEASKFFSQPAKDTDGGPMRRNKRGLRRALLYKGLPVGLWLTRIACFLQVIFWIVLLITVAGLRSHSWYLILVGGLGMLQNAIVAAVARPPDRRGLPLTLVDTIVEYKVMDGLMDLEWTINGAGRALLNEFFPGPLREDELAWWSENRDPYDDERIASDGRGRPRSRLQKKNIDIPDIDLSGKARLYRRTSSWESSVLSGDLELRTASPPLRGRDFEPGSKIPVERPDVAMSYAPLPARNDRREKHSEDSVRSPDWA